jgi:hypothetical protein
MYIKLEKVRNCFGPDILILEGKIISYDLEQCKTYQDYIDTVQGAKSLSVDFDRKLIGSFDESLLPQQPQILCSFKIDDGRQYVVAGYFIYVMNDNGKTIDKISAI